jgi:hypothetical protein
MAGEKPKKAKILNLAQKIAVFNLNFRETLARNEKFAAKLSISAITAARKAAILPK